MVEQLQPKIRPVHPLHEHRIAAAENGWPQIPVREKRGCKGWPTIPNDAAAISSDPRWRDLYWTGTGFRVENGICVYDLDVNIKEVATEILDDLYDQDPDAYEGAIRRNSGKYSLAIIWRCLVPFRALKTHSYTAHPELLPDLAAARAMPQGSMEESRARADAIHAIMLKLDPQKVEFYGPESRGRLFQHEGLHSSTADIQRLYECEGNRWPHNTRLADVGLMPQAFDMRTRHGGLLDRADEILNRLLTRIPEDTDPGGEVVYDLTPETIFYLKDGSSDTIEALTGGMEWGAEHGVYGCLPSTLASQSQGNCRLYITNTGRTMVMDWKHDGRRHYMVGDEPPKPVEIDDATRAVLAELQPPPEPTRSEEAPAPDEPEPAQDADPTDVLNFMLRNYAVDRHAGMIVDLRAVDIERAHIEVPTFHLIYGAHRFFVPARTERGQGTWVPVSKSFLIHPQHLIVAGTRFRPDRGFPLYEEHGERFKNVWRKPRHAGDCDLTWFLETFFPIFIPDPVERDWYLDVVAHRWMHPAIPGPSVVMVAHGAVSAIGSDYGTGRSGWFDFQARLWGRRYVRNEDFAVVVGQNRQGDYTSWKAFKRLVTIDEAKTSPEQNTMKGGSATYEILKTMVDPSPRWRTFKVKYGKPFEEFDYAPLDIASNHQGAVAVPAGDRRFGVINNGRPLTPTEARTLYAVIQHPGAPAAFARWCEARDLSKFEPFAPPPVFAAKARMQALSETELDGVFALMEQRFGVLFTKSQAREFALNNLETRPSPHDLQFDKRFDAAFRHYCTALRDQSTGGAGTDMRVHRPMPQDAKKAGIRVGSSAKNVMKRERAYTFDSRKVDLLAMWKARARNDEVSKSEQAITQKHSFRVINGGRKENGPVDRAVGPKEGLE